MRENISSQATTHKYVARLKRRKLIKDVHVKDQDERCHYIAVTDAGINLIKEWS
jgi:DNA-binding MarR family transcriptional regulator